MAKEFAQAFYKSTAWKNCQQAYMKKQAYICEKCGQPAQVVHHKIRLTADNIGKAEITLNFDNLQCLCSDCHNKIHHRKPSQSRYLVDAEGRVMLKDNLEY